MQGAHDEVSRFRCRHGKLNRLDVAQLTDENDIRVFPERAFERSGEGFGRSPHLALIDQRHFGCMHEFHRVFDREDMALHVRVDIIDHGGKRGRTVDEELQIQRLMPADALRIRGQHNALNALAALALAGTCNANLAQMLRGLREYTGEPHRLTSVAVIQDVEYFDDSKGTNVGASVAAILGLGSIGKIVLLAGGVGKGAEFSALAPVMRKHGSRAILFGADAGRIEAALDGAVSIDRVDSFEAAVQTAYVKSVEGELVLLSPACASFDMFDNYEHRGRVFTQLVEALA